MLQYIPFVRDALFQPPTPPTYDENIFIPSITYDHFAPSSSSEPVVGDGLFYIEEERIASSTISIYRLPILFVHLDPNNKEESRRNEITLLFCHGNAEDIGSYQNTIRRMSQGYRANICIFDYTGYGLYGNAGGSPKPSETDLFRNIWNVYDFLWRRYDVPKNKIIIFGRSLGSGPACYLVERVSNDAVKPLGLLLSSGMKSAAKTVTSFPVPGDIFTNYKRARQITLPTLIVHGDNDRVISYQNAIDMNNLIGGPHELVTLHGIGHNFPFVSDGISGRSGVTMIGSYRRFFDLAQFEFINNVSEEEVDLDKTGDPMSILRFYDGYDTAKDYLVIFSGIARPILLISRGQHKSETGKYIMSMDALNEEELKKFINGKPNEYYFTGDAVAVNYYTDMAAFLNVFTVHDCIDRLFYHDLTYETTIFHDAIELIISNYTDRYDDDFKQSMDVLTDLKTQLGL